MSAEPIWSKPLTERQHDSQIDYSDIPALTDEQFSQFQRPPKKLGQ